MGGHFYRAVPGVTTRLYCVGRFLELELQLRALM